MGFSAMKLINEAGIRGTAVISVVQPSARSLISASDEGMGPFNTAAFPWGPGGQAGRVGRRPGLFPCTTSQSTPRFISGNIPGRKKRREMGGWGAEKDSFPLILAFTLSSFLPSSERTGEAQIRGCFGSWIPSSQGCACPQWPASLSGKHIFS